MRCWLCLQVVSEILSEAEVEGAEMPSFERISEVFSYPLDPFQKEAVETCMSGKSVVVCAPTGAGKTAIAVGAIVSTLAAGYRVIYTTPLKALSNQKLFELQV